LAIRAASNKYKLKNKDMKQKLIDFLKFYKREVALNNATEILFTEKVWAEMFLKSINNESNEFRTVGNNEGKEEFCYRCHGINVKELKNYYRCTDCNLKWAK
jgi:hypothetical protein